MQLYHLMLNYLKSEPKARERVSKDRGIVNLLQRRYPSLERLNKEMLVEVVRDYNSLDRYWRMILNENPTLRGRDYDTKQTVAERKQLELGYQPGYAEMIK